ncbi:MAG: FMN-binding protein [Chloroflexi bacterium]|uniref:FMN-binding protein n=1 Tax=Candidatus Flexifilum breve TaxID=3140694 RepID=UPI00313583B8|nr:FMN-binding protein [Chloroflexota bacterium]
MKAAFRKHWKRNALGASALALSTIIGYSGITSVSADATDQTIPTTPTAPQGRGGRGGRGGADHHLQGMNLNPPAVELAPAESSVTPTQSTELAPGAEYYDGQYYGDAVSAGRWGTMQVVAVIEDGELVDVLIANYPRSTTESDIITRNALPTLISEAITAQSADVNFVSRATDSSRAFVASLDSALLDAAIGMDL